ncbi:hypothetical protein IW261DRAFT_1575669 [Armillaria novae-zelandiae]|uniref:Uncharacterized protein n=1 Tax=Armillaria novae-zelandiae TaxID=153914 RepID=A0AA39ND25_9AGAR|nr:hypothetical protein IW261DRAFT_1575669 [Armillaria novae-zelandiae]
MAPVMMFSTYILSCWPVTPTLRVQLIADLHHALRLERDSIDNHSGGYRNLLCTIARLPDDDHPEYTIRVYDPKYHFLGALHYNPRVPDRAQFLPDNPNHRAMRVIRLVTEKKVPDSRVYFDFSIQRSLRTILVV